MANIPLSQLSKDQVGDFIRKLRPQGNLQSTGGVHFTYFSSIGNRPARKAFLTELARDLSKAGLSSSWHEGNKGVGFCFINNTWKVSHKDGDGKTVSVSTLSASHFTTGAATQVFNYHDEDVPCYAFTSAKQLEHGILEGLKNAASLKGTPVHETFENYFANPSEGLVWPINVPELVRKKLGVYLGELLIGWALLGKKGSAIAGAAVTNFTGRPKVFLLPKDSNYNGCDSFYLTDDGFYALSSKFGKGAKASVFGNLMEPVQHATARAPSKTPPVCKGLLVTAARGLSKKDTSSIVYLYGLNTLLGIKVDRSTADKCLLDVKTQKYGKNRLVAEAATKATVYAKKHASLRIDTNIIPRVKKAPTTLTAFFNQTIAALLNGRAEMAFLETVLAGKDYWQINMNEAAWSGSVNDTSKPGRVVFSAIHTRKAKLSFWGNKAPITDPGAGQGWVNYLMES